MDFNKSSLSIDEQIALLQKRGMLIDGLDKAKHYLKHISYYKLSGYWFTFLKEPHSEHLFKQDTEFRAVINTYFFDRKLRLLLFDQIERLENSFKTQLIHIYSRSFGSHWFYEDKIYKKESYKDKFIDILTDNVAKSKEIFIEHYKHHYNNPKLPPSWMSLEISTLGQVSLLYKNLKPSHEKKEIANSFGIDHIVLESWMESLSFIRNVCAHHARLWNKQLPIKPLRPKNPYNEWINILPDTDKFDRIYLILAIIYYLSKVISPNTSFNEKLKVLLDEYDKLPKHYMGFPKDWLSDEFWGLKK
jgi:abortive infection bacteriophage resistance protein